MIIKPNLDGMAFQLVAFVVYTLKSFTGDVIYLNTRAREKSRGADLRRLAPAASFSALSRARVAPSFANYRE